MGVTEGQVERRTRGAEVIAALEAAGISRAQIAERTGFGLRSIYRWAASENAPHPAMLALLESLLDRTKKKAPAASPAKNGAGAA